MSGTQGHDCENDKSDIQQIAQQDQLSQLRSIYLIIFATAKKIALLCQTSRANLILNSFLVAVEFEMNFK